jgi:hypothetical protein
MTSTTEVGDLRAALSAQSLQRGAALALRRKQRGIWREQSWSQLEAEVSRAASALARLGLGRGRQLTVWSAPRPELFVLILAAGELGAEVCLLSSADELARVPARWLFVDQADELEQLLPLWAADGVERAVLYVEGRGIFSQPPLTLLEYGALLELGASGPKVSAAAPCEIEAAHPQPSAAALREIEADSPQPSAATLTRAQIGRASAPYNTPAAPSGVVGPARGSTDLDRGHAKASRQLGALLPRVLSPDAEVLGLPGLSASSYLETVVPAWLQSGSVLAFAEHASTADSDRRELGPSALFGSLDDYRALHRRVLASAPRAGSWSRRWFDRALDPGRANCGFFGRWLIHAPLRDVLGLSRVQRAWIVDADDELDHELQAWFARLGVRLEHCDASAADGGMASTEPSADTSRILPGAFDDRSVGSSRGAL